MLLENGAIQLVGDARATRSRKEVFPISIGLPTAGFVGEGARKPVTGLEFSQTSLNVKKIASIMLLTDELREDLINGDVDSLIDNGIRAAIADVTDAHILGKDSGADITSSFDTMLRSTTSSVELDVTTKADRLRLAISAAMGILEANGYGKFADMRLVVAADVPQHVRDARLAGDLVAAPLYDDSDPFYGLRTSFSTNLNTLAAATAAGKIVAFLAHAPNLHLRIRRDVTVAVSSDATVNDGTSDRFLWQEDMQGLRYVTRIGFLAHDLNRAVVKILDAVT